MTRNHGKKFELVGGPGVTPSRPARPWSEAPSLPPAGAVLAKGGSHYASLTSGQRWFLMKRRAQTACWAETPLEDFPAGRRRFRWLDRLSPAAVVAVSVDQAIEYVKCSTLSPWV